MSEFVGADIVRLTATAHRLERAAARLATIRNDLTRAIDDAPWRGPDAAAVRDAWHSTLAASLHRASAGCSQLARRADEHAREQRRASGALERGQSEGTTSSPIKMPFRRSPARRLGAQSDGFSRFERPADGRSAVVAAMEALADPDRVAFDEIELRTLDNGRFVVVLPGVTDLSDGVGQFAEVVRRDGPFALDDAVDDVGRFWDDNDAPTVRKMKYAIDAARGRGDDVYAAVVLEALEDTGVPPGADLLVIGHSYGAYAAMALASERECRLDDTGEAEYHLNVTHVVAAGAETDWRLDGLRPATSALVLNNELDVVVRAEDVLHGDARPVRDQQLEKWFWGGWDGYGHDERNYIEWVREATDHDDLARWLDDVGASYADAGERISVRVGDPHR